MSVSSRRNVVSVCLLVASLLPAQARAQNWSFDARAVGLGGVGSTSNVAADMVDEQRPYRAIVLPFGLLQVIPNLPKLDPRLLDPKSNDSQQPKDCKNEYRSIKPELWVAVGICTHLGCSPTYRPEIAPADLGGDWLGGFFCPCHQSKFDLAGRVYRGVPAPLNLVVPPYKYVSDTLLLIGEEPKT